MTLFHTSTIRIPSPDTCHSRDHLDFGRGFYLTPLESQARNYGQRFIRRGDPAVMNIYRFSDAVADAARKTFLEYDGEWLDFIAACRKGLPHMPSMTSSKAALRMTVCSTRLISICKAFIPANRL